MMIKNNATFLVICLPSERGRLLLLAIPALRRNRVVPAWLTCQKQKRFCLTVVSYITLG